MATKEQLCIRQHDLKCHAPYFDEVKMGFKRFEIRKNDRFYQMGDIIRLFRYISTKYGWSKDLKAEPLRFVAGPILQGGQFGLEAGYCAFSLFTEQEWSGQNTPKETL